MSQTQSYKLPSLSPRNGRSKVSNTNAHTIIQLMSRPDANQNGESFKYHLIANM